MSDVVILRGYARDVECNKCGHHMVVDSLCSGRKYTHNRWCEVAVEHLHWGCPFCGWMTLSQTKDAK